MMKKSMLKLEVLFLSLLLLFSGLNVACMSLAVSYSEDKDGAKSVEVQAEADAKAQKEIADKIIKRIP